MDIQKSLGIQTTNQKMKQEQISVTKQMFEAASRKCSKPLLPALFFGRGYSSCPPGPRLTVAHFWAGELSGVVDAH
jgi:hypothetical protein